MIWSTFLLAAFAASSLASPAPLSTSASTVTTLSGLGPGSAHGGILIHVLRTEDLIADKIPSKPLLLERLSHLLIRVELGSQTVDVNGHHLPILPGAHRPLEISVELNQVQMLKMPSDSPLVPLHLSAPEALNIADKYMSEGIVAAMLRVTQEPLIVQATREDNSPVEAQAFKVTIAIKILEVDGLSLAQTDIPPVDLLHLIVHPDPKDHTKVATITTLSPEALADPTPAPAVFASHPAGEPGSPFDITRSSLESTFQALRNVVHGMAAQTSALLNRYRSRKPCHSRPHPGHKQVAKPVQLAKATVDTHKHAQERFTGRVSAVDAFRHKMNCIAKALARSSFAFLLLALPLALAFMVLASVLSTLVRRRRDSRIPEVPTTYKAVFVDEKLSDEEAVVLMAAVDAHKS